MVEDPFSPSIESMAHVPLGRRGFMGVAGGVLGAVWMSGLLAGPVAADAGSAPLFQRLGEIVIPTTGTPGAGTAEVFAFASRAVEKGLFGVPADLFARLRAELDARAGGDFLRLPAARQEALVAALDAESYRPGTMGESPWCMTKTLILVGYYTGEAGGSRELDYQLVPGRYDPDIQTGKGYRALSNDWTGLSIRKEVTPS